MAYILIGETDNKPISRHTEKNMLVVIRAIRKVKAKKESVGEGVLILNKVSLRWPSMSKEMQKMRDPARWIWMEKVL